MAIVGNRKMDTYASAYENHPLRAFAQSFADLNKNVVNESGVDILLDTQKAFARQTVQESVKNFFIEDSFAENGYASVDEYNQHVNEMSALFENDLEAVQEYAAISGYNPVIGMSFPIHKNILMNSVFDKGAIQKAVSQSPKFTITME